MREATAWIIDLGAGLRAALGPAELIQIAAAPALFEIPQTPDFCRNVMVWEESIVPVLDLAAWLADERLDRSELYVGLVGVDGRPQEGPQPGALLMAGVPTRARVKDEQACDLPEQPSGWRHIACSCFAHDGEAVPVLDLPFLFSGAAGFGSRITDTNDHGKANGWLVSNRFAFSQARPR